MAQEAGVPKWWLFICLRFEFVFTRNWLGYQASINGYETITSEIERNRVLFIDGRAI